MKTGWYIIFSLIDGRVAIQPAWDGRLFLGLNDVTTAHISVPQHEMMNTSTNTSFQTNDRLERRWSLGVSDYMMRQILDWLLCV